jgi:recombination protein U
LRGNDSIVNYANRGKGLENLVEWSCRYYKNKQIAIINKIPTPFKILGRFRNFYYGHYDRKSTVDFEGLFKNGTHIAFDCKQTKGLRFALDNVKQHQFDYLINIHNYKGIAFLLIEFTDIEKIIRLPIFNFNDFVGLQSDKRGSKSIAYEQIKGFELTNNNKLPVDFLQDYY